jgi:Domain of unknown function (DUF4260)
MVEPGYTNGGVRRLLQLEGLALFALAIAFYIQTGAGWKLFAILILVPDISMIFYIAGPRIGSYGYNTMHSTIGPIAATAAGVFLNQPLAIDVGLIWAAHVGIDRAMGFGLKYATSFGDTHLGRIGRRARATAAA